MKKLTIAAIRKIAAQIKAVAMMPVDGKYTFLAKGVRLTFDGVVVFPGGFMHPQTFREIAGEAAYQVLLAQPRVPSEYQCGQRKAPKGWYCTRDDNHEGPCAAVPVIETGEKTLLWNLGKLGWWSKP